MAITIAAFTHNGNIPTAVLSYSMSDVSPLSSGPVSPFRFVSSTPPGTVYVRTLRNGDAKTYSVTIKASLPDGSFETSSFSI